VGTKKGGILVVIKDEIALTGKPAVMPSQIIGDVTDLAIGDKLTIDDLNIPMKVEVLENGKQVVAICRAPATKEKAAVLIEGFVECPLEAAKVGNQPMIA